ncbi:MAG: hypothetical protein KKF48_05680 [Nanoarchaeota archaeon]|nr:hypothetical protein [Nanoarchaeota archaeon]MBU1028508.1 hypothetical protein [Nanoarchaeota archaeon]
MKKDNKKFEKISGKVQSIDFSKIFNDELDEDNKKQKRVLSKNYSLSTDKRLNDPIMEIYGGGTSAIRRFWSLKLNLKSEITSEWELENWINKKLYEGGLIGERDILTKEVEKLLARDIIEFLSIKLKDKDLNYSQKLTYEDYIKDCKEVLKGYENVEKNI